MDRWCVVVGVWCTWLCVCGGGGVLMWCVEWKGCGGAGRVLEAGFVQREVGCAGGGSGVREAFGRVYGALWCWCWVRVMCDVQGAIVESRWREPWGAAVVVVGGGLGS